jgi:hypothetical protein
MNLSLKYFTGDKCARIFSQHPHDITGERGGRYCYPASKERYGRRGVGMLADNFVLVIVR